MLSNKETYDINIKDAKPVLKRSISDKIIVESSNLSSEYNLQHGFFVSVSGEILLNFKGVLKSNMEELAPLITGFKVHSTIILDIVLVTGRHIFRTIPIRS